MGNTVWGMANTVGLTLIVIIALAVSRATALKVTNQFYVKTVLYFLFTNILLCSVTSATALLMEQTLVTMILQTGEEFIFSSKTHNKSIIIINT